MEMLVSFQEGRGIGDELTASEEALRFGWASWAIHGLFKKQLIVATRLALVFLVRQ